MTRKLTEDEKKSLKILKTFTISIYLFFYGSNTYNIPSHILSAKICY